MEVVPMQSRASSHSITFLTLKKLQILSLLGIGFIIVDFGYREVTSRNQSFPDLLIRQIDASGFYLDFFPDFLGWIFLVIVARKFRRFQFPSSFKPASYWIFILSECFVWAGLFFSGGEFVITLPPNPIWAAIEGWSSWVWIPATVLFYLAGALWFFERNLARPFLWIFGGIFGDSDYRQAEGSVFDGQEKKSLKRGLIILIVVAGLSGALLKSLRFSDAVYLGKKSSGSSMDFRSGLRAEYEIYYPEKEQFPAVICLWRQVEKEDGIGLQSSQRMSYAQTFIPNLNIDATSGAIQLNGKREETSDRFVVFYSDSWTPPRRLSFSNEQSKRIEELIIDMQGGTVINFIEEIVTD